MYLPSTRANGGRRHSPKALTAAHWLIGFGIGALAVTFSTAAHAQMGMGGMGMSPGMGGAPSPAKSKPKAKPVPDGTPELHAAAGGADSTLPEGSEPELPPKPLEMAEAVSKRIGSDVQLEQPDFGRGLTTNRGYYGLFYHEESDRYKLKLAFPVWMERTAPSFSDPSKTDRASLFAGVYYNRRTEKLAEDIVFPVFWNLRDGDKRTTIIGPLVNRVTPTETDNWLAPLYFTGTRPDGSYQIVPPLLTYLNHDKDGGLNIVGLAGFCSWKGGSACFGENRERDLGIAPLFFAGHTESSEYRLIPPLLHYHKHDAVAERTLDVWGPFYRESLAKREIFHVLPFYYSIWGKDERHTTLLPLFHYGWNRDASLLVTPLFLNKHSQEGADTFVSLPYVRHRGRTELDMLTPLLWLYREPAIGLDQTLLFPFYYRRTSPRESSFALFPLVGRFERFGLSTETWITPLFNYTHDTTGWSTTLLPIGYFGRAGSESHAVVAPIFWDFSGPSSRSTVVAPIFWRFAKPDSLTQLVGNLLYTEQRVAHGKEWKLHVLPAFSYGETPDGHSWDVLFGLIGYRRQADLVQLKLFWVPITVAGDEKPK